MIFFFFLKEISYAHQSLFDLNYSKNSNIVKYYILSNTNT